MPASVYVNVSTSLCRLLHPHDPPSLPLPTPHPLTDRATRTTRTHTLPNSHNHIDTVDR